MEKEENSKDVVAEESDRCKTAVFFEAITERAAANTTRNVTNNAIKNAAEDAANNATENVTSNAIKSAAESTGPEALSDKNLYALCKKYGGKARKWAREFGFLLPEVARRGLHRKKGFESIYEFAGRLAGMSREVVYRVLSLHAKLNDMPKLWRLLKTDGWCKLKLVAAVATPQTEDYWVDKVENMSKETLALFIKELRNQEKVEASNLFNSDFGPKDFGRSSNIPLNKLKDDGALNFGTEITDTCDANAAKLRIFRKLKFQVDGATEIDLRVFKAELEKVRKEAVTMGEALRALLEIAELAKMLSKCMPKEYRGLFPYWRA